MLGRDLERQLQSDENRFTVDKNTISNVLNFLSFATAETIAADIRYMLEKEHPQELDGYVFALSRLMKHDSAWAIITTAFSEQKSTIPPKYYKHFGK